MNEIAPGKSTRRASCHDCAIRAACTLSRLGIEVPSRVELPIRERVFHRGDVLLEEGHRAGFVRFLKLGTVFGYRRGVDGCSRPIGVVSRGNALGIFGILDIASQATCVALSTVRVCEVPVADLRGMHAGNSIFPNQISRSLSEMVAALTTWSEAMRLQGVVNQLAYILVLMADANHAPIVQLPSHSDLAELLGTRRESIARALRTLERQGGIRRHEFKRCEVHRDTLLTGLSKVG